MRVLIVCSKNSGKIAPFIVEQVEALNRLGVTTDYFTIGQKGVGGYLKSRKPLLGKIADFRPDIIHAHFGLSGLLANLQRRVPVVTTYHGSDINCPEVFRFSKWSIRLSAYNVFVSKKNFNKAVKNHQKATIIPCGVDIDVFSPMDKYEARKQIGLAHNNRLVLFAGSFKNSVKNPELAISAVRESDDETDLIELAGYNRQEVSLLMNAVDVCLMTSHNEGSPQFIKEAMACNCPIISVDVGDVSDIVGETYNCFITDYKADEIANNIQMILKNGQRSNGREKIIYLGLDNISIANRILDVYKTVTKNQ